MSHGINKKHLYHFGLPPAVGDLVAAIRKNEGRLLQKLMELCVLCYAKQEHPDLYKAYLKNEDKA